MFKMILHDTIQLDNKTEYTATVHLYLNWRLKNEKQVKIVKVYTEPF